MDYSPPGSSVHGILQARILEWVAFPFSRGSSWPRDQTPISCIAGRFLTTEPPGKPFVDYKALFKEENFLLLSCLLEKTFPPLLCTSNSCPDCSAGLFVFCYPVVTKQNFGSEERTRLTCPILSWLVSPVSCVRSCVHFSLCPAQPWECKPRFSWIKECRGPLVVCCWLCILNPVISTTSSAAPGVVCLEPHWLKPARCLEIEMWAHAATKEAPDCEFLMVGRGGGARREGLIKWAKAPRWL